MIKLKNILFEDWNSTAEKIKTDAINSAQSKSNKKLTADEKNTIGSNALMHYLDLRDREVKNIPDSKRKQMDVWKTNSGWAAKSNGKIVKKFTGPNAMRDANRFAGRSNTGSSRYDY